MPKNGNFGALAAVGRALADPIRLEILRYLAQGRSCCAGLDIEAPFGEEDEGVCVCEIQALVGLGQSKVSYHLRKLKDAEMVTETKRGKWSCYSLRPDTVDRLVILLEDVLGGHADGDARHIGQDLNQGSERIAR